MADQAITNREELVGKLGLLSRALASQNVIQILQHYIFNGETVAAYNDSIGIVAPCKSTAKFALHGPTLLGLLETCSGEDATFTADKTHVTIRSGRSTFNLPFLDETAFIFEEPTGAFEFKLPVNDKLIAGMKASLLTVSDDLSKPALMGVCLLRDKTTTTLYSCDGDGLTKAPLGKGGTPHRMMMPSSFCEAVIAVMEKTEPDKGPHLSANTEWVWADLGNGYSVYGRLIEVDEPVDYEGLTTQTIKKSKHPYVTVPEGLDTALARAQVINKFESTKTVLTVDTGTGRLKLLTENTMGTVRDSFQFKSHPEVEAKVSAELTGRAIKLCTEMAIHDNCIAYRHPDSGLFVLMSNMDR